jgi:diguanylate cyclase (GGDEF)-like protein
MQNNMGEYVWFEDNVIPFFDDNGELKSISGFCRNIQNRKELEQKLEELSYHDGLTGLFSNNYYAIQSNRLNEALNTSVGIIMCDLDNLKAINDTLGHAYGDKLIINFANLLKNEFGNHSIIIRKGGDEFIIMIESITEEFTLQLYSCLLETLDKYNSTYPLLPLKASVGWAYTPTSLGQVEKAFNKADEMMYCNKMDKKHSVS